MAEPLGLVASFIAIGQVLAGLPQAVEFLRTVKNMRNELTELISEFELLKEAKEYIDRVVQPQNATSDISPEGVGESAFCRTVRAQLEDVVNKTYKLVGDCNRGLDRSGKPRPRRLKWMWNKSKVDALYKAARQARLDLQLVLFGHMITVQQSAKVAQDILKYQHALGDHIGKTQDTLARIVASREADEDGDEDGEECGLSAVHLAAKGLQHVEQELEDDPDGVNRRDENGKAPLHWACQGANEAVVKILIREGADVNVTDFNGQTPLMTAVHRGALLCAYELARGVQCRAAMCDAHGRSALHYAAASPYPGGSAVMEHLLEHGADPNRRSRGGETPLHELASSYTTGLPVQELHERAMMLVASGAELEATDVWYYTPALQAAAEDNHRALDVSVRQRRDDPAASGGRYQRY